MELETLIERAQRVRESLPLPAINQRMGAVAESLSRAADEQVRVEIVNEALLAATTLCYQTIDGIPVNIDRRTGKVLVKLPWGRSGWNVWGLRYWEIVVLNGIVRVRTPMRRPVPLFDYNEFGARWFLNVTDYPMLDAGLTYWQRHPVLVADWLRYADLYRQRAAERMEKRRGAE
jgi:hypothetical protein